jgi:LysR family transcriptional regulator, glycine cleavage system transcriptional activator
MNAKFPPLNAIRAFEAAARHKSFARAANELHVTPAAISHQIKQLESWLDLSLFSREANGVALTAAGRDYALRIHEVFERLAHTSNRLRENRERVVVTIRAQFSVASMWLLPRVIAFNRAQSDIDIRVYGDMDRPSAKLGADLAIYNQRPEVAGYQQDLLIGGTFKLYAAPGFLRGGVNLTPREALMQPLIHLTLPERDWSFPTFHDWFRAAGIETPVALPGLQFNLLHMVAAACEQGAGLALMLDTFCAGAVRSGNLIALPGPTIPSAIPYYLMSRTNASEEVKMVRDWLLGSATGESVVV